MTSARELASRLRADADVEEHDGHQPHLAATMRQAADMLEAQERALTATWSACDQIYEAVADGHSAGPLDDVMDDQG